MNLQDTLNNRKILNNKENITILTRKIVNDFFNKNPNAKTFVIPFIIMYFILVAYRKRRRKLVWRIGYNECYK